MAYHVELQFAAKTDTGLVRSHNEDSVALSPTHGLAILADGMGGYQAGEVASGIATGILKESLEARLQNFGWALKPNRSKSLQQMVVESIEHANIAIYEAARSELQYGGMGTTLVMAMFHNDKAIIAHVGDSRAYRFRQGEVDLITRDHSFLQEQIDAGLIDPEWARFSPNRNLVTRAVGVNYGVEVEVAEHQTEAGDIYLLCSDGLSDMLSTQEINEILTRAIPVSQPQAAATQGEPGADPSESSPGEAASMDAMLDATCSELIQRANDNGGRDNISVILVKVQSRNAEAKGWLEQLISWVK